MATLARIICFVLFWEGAPGLKGASRIFASGNYEDAELDKVYTQGWRGLLYQARQDQRHQFLMAGKGEVYEFGVFNGASMRKLRGMYPTTVFWGFDSFEGLPETVGDDNQTDWAKGNWKGSVTQQKLIESLGGPGKTHFVRGFYNESLTPQLRDQMNMGIAEYIDIDCDLYISARQALDWAFANGVAVPGTLIGYDDWWVNSCSKGGESLNPLETGEGKAHLEMVSKYKVNFRCVAGSCMPGRYHAWGPIFIIDSVGNSTLATPGFNFTAEELHAWKRENPLCKGVHESKNWDIQG